MLRSTLTTITRFVAIALLCTAMTAVPTSAATPAPESYGCIILIDGLRGDMARKYAEEGLMPNVKKYFLEGGIWADRATSVFPSITGAAIPSVVTGAYPGRHNLPSLYFFEREERKYYVLYTVKGSFQFNRLLDTKRTKTVFEHFPGKNDTWAIGLHVNRGADKVIPVALNVGYKPLAWAAKLAEFFRGIKRAFTGGHPARLVLVYNGWFDHIEHTLGVESEELKEHYVAVDNQIGECIDTYKKLGIFDQTYFTLVSDHGQLGFDQSVNIWDYIKGTHQIPIVENVWKKIPLLPLDWDVNNPDNYEDYVMVVPAGQGHALLYFAKPGETNNWDERPTYEELLAYPINGHTVNVIEEVRNQDAVDFAMLKNRKDGRVVIFGQGNRRAVIERRLDANGHSYRYTVASDETDPLNFTEEPSTCDMVNRDPEVARDDMWFSDREWQLATNDTNYLDGVTQLYQVFDSERAPDIYISGAPGYNLIGSTYDGEVSRHGALNKYESHTTWAIAGPGLAPQRIKTARSVDCVPSLLHCMQVPFDPSMMDGQVIAPVAERIMGAAEKSNAQRSLEEYMTELRRFAETGKLLERLQTIGASDMAAMNRLIEMQSEFADMAARIDERTNALITDLQATAQADDGQCIRDLCRYLRSLGDDDTTLIAPFVKTLARSVNHELASELKGCLE